ncbi:uncharacterized protein LOC131060470 [Cryptomeria japonica]|uniref:uncharacterized protein LOC131060470 n=1 Tax=Cryptomeria japonica TaxID=3369 RepID=UPI0027DA3E8A|nr:uncharacterized protein LOC131060470 [Cryptomeria japonica]
MYNDLEKGENKFEPAQNDDRVNTHNKYVLQLWRENIDWQPVLSRHAVIKCIAKYAATSDKSCETHQQMLLWLANIETPNDSATKAYRNLLTKTIIERDIGAQETSHMLLELPLVESSKKIINLNVSTEVFKRVVEDVENNDEEHTVSFIYAYLNKPFSMEAISLIDVAKSWIYNLKRKSDNKWNPRKKESIVGVFPRFTSIPTRGSEKWITFCFSELLLYKPFHNIQRHIGNNDDTIQTNWDNFNYNQWHVQRRIEIEIDENIEVSKTEENDTRQEETTENEWEIISRLHRGQLMQTSEIEILDRRDLDKETNWSTDYEGEEYTDKAMSFIATMKSIGSLIHDDIP